MSTRRFSPHAITKLCLRRISIGVVLLAAQHGTFGIAGRPGRHLSCVDAAAVQRCPLLKSAIGLVVVVATDGDIITAYWERSNRRAA